jgi:hypothetical protein
VDAPNKIKLSSDFIIIKLFLLFALCFSLLVGPVKSKNDIAADFKTGLEYKIFIVISVAGLAYFFTRPAIHHDDVNLYIKKITKPEMIIPLKNVTSFFENPFINKGSANFTIEYKSPASGSDSITFNTSYTSDSIKNFRALIKKINPHVEIV